MGKMKRRNSGVGTVIRDQRKRKRLTQEELAWATGISKSHISKVERGESIPSFDVLRKIEDALGLGYMSLDEKKIKYAVNENIEQTAGEIKLDLLRRDLSEDGIAIVAHVTKAVADVIESMKI